MNPRGRRSASHDRAITITTQATEQIGVGGFGVDGYRHDTLGEDMELVVRLHRVLSARGQR